MRSTNDLRLTRINKGGCERLRSTDGLVVNPRQTSAGKLTVDTSAVRDEAKVIDLVHEVLQGVGGDVVKF